MPDQLLATFQQFLRAGMIDEMRLAFVPVLLGRGERLLDNLGDEPIGHECVDMVCSASATHVRFVRKATSSAAAPPVGGPLPERASIGIRMAGAIAAWAIGACRVNPACRPASPACQPGRPLCQLARLTCWQPLPNT